MKRYQLEEFVGKKWLKMSYHWACDNEQEAIQLAQKYSKVRVIDTKANKKDRIIYPKK